MKKINYFGLTVAVLMVITVFLPWLGVNSSASIGGYGGSFNVSVSGIYLWGGIVGLIITIVGSILMFKNFRFTILAGLFNLIISVGYIFGWFLEEKYRMDVKVDYGAYGGASASSSVDTQFGLYAFAVCSLLFIVFSIKYLKGTKNAAKIIDNNNDNVKSDKQNIHSSTVEETQTCSNCNSKYPKVNKFCPNCGTPSKQEIFCTNCGTKISAEGKFCPSCGQPVSGKSTGNTIKTEIDLSDL
jgi:RNA polymerase subunit RPABC4/transcription elongation factor Spt4